jgi:hypothetical protein
MLVCLHHQHTPHRFEEELAFPIIYPFYKVCMKNAIGIGMCENDIQPVYKNDLGQ